MIFHFYDCNLLKNMWCDEGCFRNWLTLKYQQFEKKKLFKTKIYVRYYASIC